MCDCHGHWAKLTRNRSEKEQNIKRESYVALGAVQYCLSASLGDYAQTCHSSVSLTRGKFRQKNSQRRETWSRQYI